MVHFECPRCLQILATKQKLKQHLYRKKQCIAVTQNTAIPFENVENITLTIKGYSLQTLINLLGQDRILCHKVEAIVEPPSYVDIPENNLNLTKEFKFN